MFVGISLMMKRNRNDSGDFKTGKVPRYSAGGRNDPGSHRSSSLPCAPAASA